MINRKRYGRKRKRLLETLTKCYYCEDCGQINSQQRNLACDSCLYYRGEESDETTLCNICNEPLENVHEWCQETRRKRDQACTYCGKSPIYCWTDNTNYCKQCHQRDIIYH